MPFSEMMAYLLDMKYASYATAGREADCNVTSDMGYLPEGCTNISFTPLEYPVCN